MADATRKITYAARAGITITLASLGSSATFVAGRESTVIDNTTNRYIDALVGGLITVGTSPTADTFIHIWVYAAYTDTPTYPDVLDGTDSAETMTSEGVRDSVLKLGASIRVDATTSDRGYYFQFNVASLFGRMPDKWGLFIAHNTGVNLNATGSNHDIDYMGIHELADEA